MMDDRPPKLLVVEKDAGAPAEAKKSAEVGNSGRRSFTRSKLL